MIAGNSMQKVTTFAFILGFIAAVNVFGVRSVMAQDVNKVASGQQVKKFKGVVTKRESDYFLMGDTMGGPQTVVVITNSTEVKSHKKGVFRGSKMYELGHILRGLRLEVDGVGNSEGALEAQNIRFDEQDLRTAQALRSTVDPVEADLRRQLAQQQAEAERLAGQLQETQAVAMAARSEAAAASASAKEAAEAARKAQGTADTANNRINGLDDFDVLKTITVTFPVNSFALTNAAKTTINEAADWVKSQNTKGWVAEIIGYADTTGNNLHNRILSEKRANSVIYYLVTEKGLKPQRLVQPFGAGQTGAVAANDTRAGRAKNRRVEIKLMVNKGISGNVGGDR
jgi:outer membrane protein OmpA-like peptidoglycan-associated protein